MDESRNVTKNSSPEAKKGFWSPVATVILTFAVFLISQVIGGLVILSIPSILGWDKLRTDNWLDSVGVKFALIFLIEVIIMLAVHWLLKIKKKTFRYIGLKAPRVVDLIYAVLGLGVYFLSFIAISALVKIIFPSIDFNQEQQIGFETYEQGFSLFLIFFSLVLAVPFVEEVLARGFLYTGLKNGLPKWGAVIVTSLLFALAHLQFGSGNELLWVAAIDTFILSLALIYLREKTGGLGAPIMLHMLKNGIAFVLLFVLHAR